MVEIFSVFLFELKIYFQSKFQKLSQLIGSFANKVIYF